MTPNLTLGIDASNLRQGGGITHLRELLSAADPSAHGFVNILVWGSQSTLAELEDRDWLIKRNPSAQERGLIPSSLWQYFMLAQQTRAEKCDVLFVPGGSYTGNFYPIVTMSRNMLPFEWQELKRFGISWIGLRLILLRWIQIVTFRKADGVIFLTRYAHQAIQRVTGHLPGSTIIIPHGLNTHFIQEPRPQKAIDTYSRKQPFKIIYVSIISYYKHQWNVVEALAALRQEMGWSIVLELVGPYYSPALTRLRNAMDRWDPQGEWIKYYGNLPHSKLRSIYNQADLGLFASSCENMPNILLETMASGLPIASSDREPMSEILGDAGVYFDPEDPVSIAWAVKKLVADPILRTQLSAKSFSLAQKYRWEICAKQTFDFLASIHQQWVEKQKSHVI